MVKRTWVLLCLAAGILVGAAVPACGATISGRITQWQGGAPGVRPTQKPLLGAIVIVGSGSIWLDTQDTFTDYVRDGLVVAETRTDANGNYSVDVAGGTPPYRVIVWKQAYVPDTSPAIGAIPATRDTSLQPNAIQAGGKHSTLRIVSQTLAGQKGRAMRLGTTGLSFVMPAGYSVDGDANALPLMLVSPHKTMILGHAEPGGVDSELGVFADAFMRDIGPAMGAADLQTVASSNVQIAPGVPGIMRVANATMQGRQARFAFLFFTTADYVYTWLYGAQVSDYDTCFGGFTALLQTVEFK